MDGDCVSSAYTVLLCARLVCRVRRAGAYVCFGMSPLAPYGPISFPLLPGHRHRVVVVLRNARQLVLASSRRPPPPEYLVMIVGATVGDLVSASRFDVLTSKTMQRHTYNFPMSSCCSPESSETTAASFSSPIPSAPFNSWDCLRASFRTTTPVLCAACFVASTTSLSSLRESLCVCLWARSTT